VLALVEGWVSTVVDEVAATRLPQASALAEAIRRRRATGGPAERTFATLVGLELRPRRLREAAAIWRGLTDERGVSGRDAVWAHPDLLPGPDDFDDPDGFVRGRPELDISDLDLEGLTGEAAAGDGPADGKPGDDKPGDDKPGDDKPGDDKRGDDKPGDDKPGEADGKPGADGG
jgi:zinicin-like metallopeptidase